MLTIEWPRFLESGLPLNDKPISATIGVFDGVHRGHRALIERVVSHNADFAPVAVTFRENHKTGENSCAGSAATDIQSFEEKLAMFEKLGIQMTLAIDFTESFRRMSGREFLELFSGRSKIGFLAVGSKFRCGFGLDTDAAAIKEFFASRNVPVEIVPEVLEDGLPISSSRIRAAIAAGDLALAEKMLGRRLERR